VAKLKEAGIRTDIDDSNESLGKKIRESKTQKIPYTLVIGDAEVAANGAALESRDSGKLGVLSIEEIISKLSQEIKNRS
jgi:threonyl-tRNA synthetase